MKQEATAPSAALVSRRCGGAYRGTETTATVAEVLQRYVKMTFLVPLLAWMQQWKELGITHPVSFKYCSIIDPLTITAMNFRLNADVFSVFLHADSPRSMESY